MSSNIRILKICEYCRNEFIVRKTTSQTCSDACAKRFYKLKQRDSKIAQAELETEIKRRPLAYIKEAELKTIQSKENLTLKEAALLLNISPLILRRWILKTKVDFPELNNKPFLTINASSASLNVSPVTLRRWIKDGMIQTKRIGKKHIIKRTDIDSVLA